MSEIPDTPPIETGPEIPTGDGGGNLSSTESFGNVEEVDSSDTTSETAISEEEAETDVAETGVEENKPPAEGPTNEAIEKMSEKLKLTAAKAEKEETDDLNTPSNEYLKGLMEQPEAPDAEKSPEGNKALITITRINEQMEQALRDFEDFVNQINGNKKPENSGAKPTGTKPDVSSLSEETTNPEPMTEVVEGEWVDEENIDGPDEQEEPSSETTDTNEETVDGEWILIDEGLEPETEEYLRENGEEDLIGQLTPEELRLYESFRQLILDRFPPVGSMSSVGTLNNMIDSKPEEEEAKLKQIIKILLRTAVRVGTRTVAFIADELVKSADKDDKTTKFIFGSIRDAAKGAESMADTAITGKDRSERLTKTTRDLLFGKKKRS